MPVSYPYIGSSELAVWEGDLPLRASLRSGAAVRHWVRTSGQKLTFNSSFVTTFIVSETSELWIADRHSEHVQCARGKPVLSAGEITFEVRPAWVSVTAITNQSTGYCPEPESWPAVAAALDKAGFAHPNFWTAAFVFRHCLSCGMTNIVKDGVFECAVCGSDLPQKPVQ